MKKIFRYTLMSLAVLIISSCTEDFIDIQPKDELTANLAFQNFADVQLGLIGAYDGFQSGNYAGTAYLTVPSIIADDATQVSENTGQQIFFHNFQYTADDNAIGPIWNRLYNMLERTNTVLDQLPNFSDEVTEQEANSVRGQALALRATVHFDLLRYFAGNEGLGVPLKLVSGDLTAPTRNTIDEVYDQVIADYTEARTLLTGINTVDNSARSPNRFTVDAINAMLARVSLYRGDFQGAVNFATEVINTSRTLATGDDFRTIWAEDVDGGTGEIIFSVTYNQGEGNIGSTLYLASNDPTNNPDADQLQWAPSQSLMNLYDQVNDVRFDSYFQMRPNPNFPPQMVDNKYRGRAPLGTTTPPNLQLHDVKLIRLTEVYLTRAEANFELGNQGVALDDLNDVREARIENYTDETITGQALLDAILDERRKEFAFEGHRWFDLKRRNLPVVRGADCIDGPAVACTLEVGNFRFILPIPQGEIFANDNIAPQQNPGY